MNNDDSEHLTDGLDLIKEAAMATPLTVEECFGAIAYYGDACNPKPGENDLRAVTAETVARLPAGVQAWLLHETRHIFLGGSGQLGEFIEIHFHKNNLPERDDFGAWLVRLVFLSERLMTVPREEARWTVAHEIAHSRLRHQTGSHTNERAADDLAESWGFAAPESREEALQQQPSTINEQATPKKDAPETAPDR